MWLSIFGDYTIFTGAASQEERVRPLNFDAGNRESLEGAPLPLRLRPPERSDKSASFSRTFQRQAAALLQTGRDFVIPKANRTAVRENGF